MKYPSGSLPVYIRGVITASQSPRYTNNDKDTFKTVGLDFHEQISDTSILMLLLPVNVIVFPC